MVIDSLKSNSESLSGYAVDLLEDDELAKLVNDLRQQTRTLRLENEVLEKSILRLDPALMSGVCQALQFANKLQSGSGTNIGSFFKTQLSKFGLSESLAPSKMFASQSRLFRKVDSTGKIICGSVFSGQGPRINLNEKLELLAITVDNQMNDLEKCKRNATKKHAYLMAQLEEADIWTADIQTATQEFNKEVVIDGWDPIAQRIPAETWIRFMAELAKKTDKQIGKLRLRTSTLNIQYRKFKEEVERKRDLSENLTPVDFDKIIIENQECLKLLENKNVQLDELKTMNGDANLNLTIHKKIMLFLNNYLAKVQKLKTRRELQTIQLDKETASIQVQVDILAQRIIEIKKMRMAYHIPNVNDYVNVKAKTSELNCAIKRLETKLHIKQTAVASTNKKLKVLLSKKTLCSSSESMQMDLGNMP